jgi:hypothetical protein
LTRQALASLKPGTAFGPHNDYTDTIKAYGLSTGDQSSNDARMPTLTKVLVLILNNRLPPVIAYLLCHCRFLALYKDEADTTKLRSIGIGTVWRRLAAPSMSCTSGTHLRPSSFLLVSLACPSKAGSISSFTLPTPNMTPSLPRPLPNHSRRPRRASFLT